MHACLRMHRAKHWHNHLTDSDNQQNPIISPIPISWPVIGATLTYSILDICGNREVEIKCPLAYLQVQV